MPLKSPDKTKAKISRIKDVISTGFESRYLTLNKEQKRAVDTLYGPVLVVAGPGSGKTELLAMRVANILHKNLASASQILCLTFTDNASINMRERLEKLIGADAYRVNIFTFHAFANHIISRYPEYFYKAASFTMASDLVISEILEKIFDELPHKHPFASYHPKEGYVYLKNFKERLQHIKKGGYTKDEWKAITSELKKDYKEINKILENWPLERLDIKIISKIREIKEKLTKIKSTTAYVLAESLDTAINEADSEGKTASIGAWKVKYLVKEKDSHFLKESIDSDKLDALAELYEKYEEAMHESGYYDYDDVIISVTHALRDVERMRNELEEQYQFILIDEFQDTNKAQMDLVRVLTANSVHEGKPNVLVVGDDDQAIYKFQGAEISNITDFRKKDYKDVETVVLTKNYRSTKEILNLSREVVLKGKNRLENRFEDINKHLVPENKSLPKGKIEISTFTSDIEEYVTVAKKIKELLKNGEKPEEIAVLAKEHKQIKNLLPYLDKEDIPYEYIKKANVFDEPHIKELISVCEYLASITGEGKTKDYLLPEIFSYNFFKINRKDIFLLASKSKKEAISWMESAMSMDASDSNLKNTAMLLAELSGDAASLPLEHLLDSFMSKSGFKDHYFNSKRLKEDGVEYVSFLASLRTFIDAIKEWKGEESILAKDVIPFVEIHRAHNLSLISESVFTKSTSAVALMTAHASKGLEFGNVFILSAHDDLWTKKRYGSKIPLPLVLAPILTPAGESEDDFIRILYVAVTRAKHSLFISAHKPLVRYLNQNEVIQSENSDLQIEDHERMLSTTSAPVSKDEKLILKKLLSEYKMPVTHLQNFLDIKNGGPMYFLMQNLLKFPQPMNPHAAFGSAVHKAIEEMITYPKYNAGDSPTLKHILSTFERYLSKERLPHLEDKRQRNRGILVLTNYYKKRIKDYLNDDMVEVDMRTESCVIGETHLTGKIDFMRKGKRGYEVTDFKTGKSFETWSDVKTDDDKIKLHNYKNQLIIYKILIENSTNYKHVVHSLALEFVEDLVKLKYEIQETDVERASKLLSAVYKKIINLDFYDPLKYEASYKGRLKLEEDLIEGKV